MYATCEACQQEMNLSNGCKVSHWREADGSTTKRVAFGEDDFPGENCPDCNTPKGSYHHAGCDIERCSRCGLQALECACLESEGIEAQTKGMANDRELVRSTCHIFGHQWSRTRYRAATDPASGQLVISKTRSCQCCGEVQRVDTKPSL